MTFGRSIQAGLLMMLAAAAGCTVKNSASGGSSTCSSDGSVSCTQGSGWSCTGKDTPADNNPLVCSKATVSQDQTKLTFCCVASQGVTSGCAEDSTVTANCSQGTGFACAGSTTPDQNDSSLVCSSGTPNGSNTDYCCIPYTQSSGTCMQDSTVMCSEGFGFTCSGTDMPQQTNSALNCSTGTAGNNGQMLYCCK
jgi:hypothetical protein